MIDWGVVGKMWGAYGTNIIVLTILLLVAWIVGIVIQRTTKHSAGDKEKPKKG
jgi:Na+-transporting methylmalonyl-CoA/oxaloacetate decarboxylase gamma subunit